MAFKVNRREFLVTGGAAAALSKVSSSLSSEQPSSPAYAIPGDMFMEVELSWFDPKDIPRSVDRLMTRVAPFYLRASGEKGILLMCGADLEFDWSGDLSQKIALPGSGVGQQLNGGRGGGWLDVQGPLTGSTDERMEKAIARFASPVTVPYQPYDAWTYAQLKRAVEALREKALELGISGLRIGISRAAIGNFDPAIGDTWAKRHREAFADRLLSLGGPALYLGALLHADAGPYGGLKHGIVEGMPLREFFAAQWSSLSKAIGFDAIMLRDGFAGRALFVRSGPWGPLAPNQKVIREESTHLSLWLREVKQATPSALVMLYSGASSAIGDWRCNGIDLEAIAKEGNFDVFVDQTWGGEWNEVGVRATRIRNKQVVGRFWGLPMLGYTYQLATLLMHSAMLAGTRVRHYPMIEMLDAYEEEVALYAAPERVRWEIWAYTHCGVKTPNGLRLPEGCYLAFPHRGRTLMSESDVRFVASSISESLQDARRTVDILGPTVVYSRTAMQWQVEHAQPDTDIKEWIDEQIGGVIKWPVPILSSTRVEWLPQVSSDLFIIQTPSHLTPSEMSAIEALIAKGQPVAFFGSPLGGLDPRLAEIAGLEAGPHRGVRDLASRQHKAMPESRLAYSLVKNLPAEFGTFHRLGLNKALENTHVLYGVEDIPVLTLRETATMKVLAWDPPDLWNLWYMDVDNFKSLSEIWHGNGSDYALAAGALNYLCAASGSLRAIDLDLRQTVNVTSWRLEDGSVRILAANLEEGLRDDADLSRHCRLQLSAGLMQLTHWRDHWRGQSCRTQDGQLQIDLPQSASMLLCSEDAN